MLRKFLPYEQNFFKLFQEAAEELEQAASQFYAMISDLQHAGQYAQTINQIEKRADKIAHATFELLHKTFITPFDRNDINAITSKLDDIVDSINRSAQRVSLYQLTQLPQEIHQLAKLTAQCSVQIRLALGHLDKLTNTTEILQHCKAVNQAENEAHQISLSGIARLFQEESDCKQLLKVKDLYEYGKGMIDQCEDLANIIKGIVLEYA